MPPKRRVVSPSSKGSPLKGGKTSQDGKELKIYVDFGCFDGLTPRAVSEKYPQFNKFEYRCFAGALARAKSSQKKQVQDRGIA